MLRFVPAIAIVLSAASAANAQELTGKPYIDMDYGPFLSMTIEADGPGKNIAYKGVMVTLDEETQTYALFDEDLMRYAAAWTGGKINWRSVIYDGSHNTHPSMVGDQIFGNAIRPGWSISGSFKDPRSLPWGPLPRGQAHYKGLYLHGDKVVFQYTVGGTMVREMPGLEKVGDQFVITRTIEVDPSTSNLTLQIAEIPEMKGRVVTDDGRKFGVLGDLSIPDVEPAQPVTPTNGLSYRWQFDDAGGLKLGRARIDKGQSGTGIAFNGRQQVEPVLEKQPVFGGRDYSISAWVQTKRGGTIAAMAAKGKWSSQGKSLFIRDGRLTLDVGWVGNVTGKALIADGQWHHVAMTHAKNGRVQLFVDGQPDGSGELESNPDPKNARLVFGQTSDNFPGGAANKLNGALDDVCLFDRVLTAAEVSAMAPGKPPAGITAAATVGAPTNASWRVDKDSSLRLHLPNSKKQRRFKVLVWNGSAKDLDQFKATAKASPQPVDLTPMTKGGPTRFEQTLTTRGKLAEEDDKAYVIDELTPPNDNPWRSWLRFGGFDFFEDSTKAAICTWNGDVWIVSGIDATLERLTWKRIATGMFQPLGVRIVNGDIYVCCRDQITVLRDLNGDGETDFYQNFNNDHQVTEHFHEFAMDLQTDAKGNFLYAKSARHAKDSLVPHHGTLIRVSADGRTSEIVCNGFRAANGVGIGPNGELSTSDQEGHWTPANRINLVRQGGFYGNMYSYHRSARPTTYDPPVVWLPKNVDRSPAESLWVTSSKWGPLSGNLISTSYGTGQVFLVPYERVGNTYQGGAVRFPLDFPTGTMRARFHPDDGQLYICGLFGWSSNKTRPGGFYRVRYTGKPAHMPVEYHVASNGIKLTFSEPLDRSSSQLIGNYAIQQWNYRWTKNYGSAHYSVADPKKAGQDDVRIKSARLLPDNKSVFLEIPDLQKVMQMKISWAIRDSNGNAFENEMHATINAIAAKFDLDKAMDAPREIAGSPNLSPGLIMETLRDSKNVIDGKTRRLLTAPKSGQSLAGVGLPTLRGFLSIDKPGRYEFRAAPKGKLGMIFIEGEPSESSGKFRKNPERLSRGMHGFTAALEPGVRIEWKSDSFDWEPVPPSALKHAASDLQLSKSATTRRARSIFADKGCIRCHTSIGSPLSSGMPELRQDAPNLADAGARFRPEWLGDWILSPKSIRPDTNMPAVLHGVDSKSDAMDIAAYLATLGSPDDIESSKGKAESAEASAGEILWEDLGCLACHKTTPVAEEDDYHRRSLNHVGKKFQSGALAAFLKAPRKHHKWRRMPDFTLSDNEASRLVAWLRSETPDAKEFETTGDPRNGRILFGSVGCANCHSVDERPPSGRRRALGEPKGEGVEAELAGCLAADDSKRGDAPDFGFTRAERNILLNFIKRDLATLAVHIPSESAERAIGKLNCAACHTRDHNRGLYAEVLAEEGTRGRPAEAVPPLTWAGEKFKTAWMAKFISGEDETRLRPHLRIRMPRFGPYGERIAIGLAHQHGVDPEEKAKASLVEGATLVMGKKLVGRDGGFNCLQCHGIGDQKPTAAFDALGVNLEQIPARIRRPFFDRWMLDPTRIDVTTKMPKLATNGRTSVRGVANGKAKPQFNAIWEYLQTLPR